MNFSPTVFGRGWKCNCCLSFCVHVFKLHFTFAHFFPFPAILMQMSEYIFSAKPITDSAQATRILLGAPGHQLTPANIEALQRQDHLVYHSHLHVCV